MCKNFRQNLTEQQQQQQLATNQTNPANCLLPKPIQHSHSLDRQQEEVMVDTREYKGEMTRLRSFHGKVTEWMSQHYEQPTLGTGRCINMT
jgi:hypothetical protein